MAKKLNLTDFKGMKTDANGRLLLVPKNEKLFRNIEEIIGGGRITLQYVGPYMLESGISHGMNRNIGRDLSSILDGLNSVERRMLYVMYLMNLKPSASKRSKVSAIIGRAMETVYPHGDGAPGKTIGRMGRVGMIMQPYVDGEGNYGNPWDKESAQSRYISAKLAEYTWDCFFSESDTLDPIYDTKPDYNKIGVEPVFLPSKYPNALVQWSSGIGVGASAVIPAFNLEELFRATIKLMEDPKAKINIYPDTYDDMIIINKADINGCFDMHKFDIKMRVPYHTVMEKDNVGGKVVDKPLLVFTGVPINSTAKAISDIIIGIKENDAKNPGNAKLLKEVKDINYKVSKKGDKIELFIEYELGYDPDVLAEKLYKYTSLQYTMPAKLVLHKDNTPHEFTPRQILLEWIEHRVDQVRRYHQQKINEAVINKIRYEAIMILKSKGYIEPLVKLIKDFSGPDDDLYEAIAKKFGITFTQAKYVANLRIKELSKLGIEDIQNRLDKAIADYSYHYDILSKEKAIRKIIVNQLEDGIKKYANPRKAVLLDKLDKKSKDDAIVKTLVYNTDNYFCVDGPEELNKLSGKLDSSYRVVEFRNDDTLLMFNKLGQMRSFTGYAFNMTQDFVSFGANHMENVVSIVPVQSHDRVALVTEKGVGKVLELDFLKKNINCKAINLAKEDFVADVCPVKSKGVLTMTSNDRLYYTQMSQVPTMGRSSAGNTIVKTNEDFKVSRIGFIPSNKAFIIMYGESGYLKVVSTEYLVFSKKATEYLTMSGKYIKDVVGIGNNAKEPVMYRDSDIGERPIVFEVSDGNVDIIDLGTGKTITKFKASTSIGAAVKCFKKGKYDFYNLFV